MTDSGDTRARLKEVAGDHGLHVATWSPGDGRTRYRFIDRWGFHAGYDGHHLSYDGASGERVTYTAGGLAEAWTYLRGYIAGIRSIERHGFIERSAAYRDVESVNREHLRELGFLKKGIDDDK